MTACVIGSSVARAVNYLRSGSVVGLPTETVYGLGARAHDSSAVSNLYALKARPPTQPLTLHVPTTSMAFTYADAIPSPAHALSKAFWPGPLTMLLPAAPNTLPCIRGAKTTIGLRVPLHARLSQVFERLGEGLVLTSANISQNLSPTRAQEVQDTFGSALAYILDGGVCAHGLDSTIVGFEGKNVIIHRSGAISAEALAKVAQCPIQIAQTTPKRPLKLQVPLHTGAARDLLALPYDKKKVAWLGFQHYVAAIPRNRQRILSPSGDLPSAGKAFFGALKALEALRPIALLAEQLPPHGLGITINERLKCAQTAA